MYVGYVMLDRGQFENAAIIIGLESLKGWKQGWIKYFTSWEQILSAKMLPETAGVRRDKDVQTSGNLGISSCENIFLTVA